jgi:branched-chain amino acid transport system substrate-binding protein
MMNLPDRLRTLTYVAVAVASVAGSPVADAAETKGPISDDIGVLVIPNGAPIQIGGYWVMSGADSALGIDEKRGVEIAIRDHRGKLVGHQIELNVEDSLCNAEGGQTADSGGSRPPIPE